ncbi:MAG: hypothetical protein WD272_04975 [Balneolales bacterium]
MICAKWFNYSPCRTWTSDDVKRISLFKQKIFAAVLIMTAVAGSASVKTPAFVASFASMSSFESVTATVTAVNSPTVHNISETRSAAAASSMLMQEDFIRDAKNAIDLHYNRQYDASLSELSFWRNIYPGHPLWMLLESLEAWWPVLTDLENTSHDDAFLDVSLKLIDYCDELLFEDEENLDARIIRSVASGQVARFYSNRYRWYRSFRHARRAMNDFFRVEETHPHIPDIHFGIGMHRYFSAYLVEEYTLARTLQWMIPDGDREEGLSRLKQAASNSIFMEPEATFFLGHIYLHFEKKPDLALDYLRDLYHKYPNNTFYRRLYIRSLYQLDHHEEALVLIDESLSYHDDQRQHEVTVMKEELYSIRGKIYYRDQQFEMAKVDFAESVKISDTLLPFGDRSVLISSLFHLGELSLRDDHREDARYFFGRAATSESNHPMVSESNDKLNKNQLR